LSNTEKLSSTYPSSTEQAEIYIQSKIDGTYLTVSSTCKEVLGYEPQEMIGKKCSQFIHPDDYENVVESFYKIEHKGIGILTYRMQKKDSRYIWLEVIVTIRRELDTVIMVARDISSRLQTEELLRKSQQKLLDSQKLGKIAFWDLDLLEKKVYSANVLLASQSSFVEGASLSDLLKSVHPEDLEVVSASMQNCIKNGDPFDYEFRIINQDGSIFYLYTIGHLSERSSNGIPLKISGATVNITDKKTSERNLVIREESYKKVLQELPEPIFININRRNVFSNTAALQLMEADHLDNLKGLTPLNFVHPDEIDSVLKRIERIKSGHPNLNTEQKWITLKGNTIFVEVKSIPTLFEGQKAALVVVRDLTKKKLAEEMMAKSENLSIAGRMAAGIAHEIRNPLTALKGFLQLIEAGVLPKEEYIKIMKDELERIELISGELLSLAKPQSYTNKHFDLIQVIENVISLLDGEAFKKKITLNLKVNEPTLEILGADFQIKQVLINLIKNAIEVMPNGGDIQLLANKNGDYAVIDIADEGIGMTEDQIKNLGTPFYTTKNQGTGLGLMVCYQLVNYHNGSLTVISELGKGSTFTVKLPLTN
jgi:two-component system, sporulation sensor kinase A